MQFLESNTYAERLLQENEERGFPGMFILLDSGIVGDVLMAIRQQLATNPTSPMWDSSLLSLTMVYI